MPPFKRERREDVSGFEERMDLDEPDAEDIPSDATASEIIDSVRKVRLSDLEEWGFIKLPFTKKFNWGFIGVNNILYS